MHPIGVGHIAPGQYSYYHCPQCKQQITKGTREKTICPCGTRIDWPKHNAK